MSETNNREAIAKALYMELRDGAYTYQLVAIPDAVSQDKTKVYKAGLIHRRVSQWSPRKNWKFSNAYTQSDTYERDPMGDLVQLENADEFVAKRLDAGNIVESISTLATRGYKLTKNAFAVEMSEKDYQAYDSYKMSPDLYRRITRSRTAFDYPTEVFDTPQASA